MYQKPKRFSRPGPSNVAALTVAATVAAFALPTQPAVAAEPILCRQSAPVYAVTGDGAMWEHLHNTPETGSNDWQQKQAIGGEWQQKTVVAGPGGRIYSITENSNLHRQRYNGTGWDSPTTLGAGVG